MGNRRLKKLSDRHKQVARMLVGGNSQSDIARLLGIDKSTVSRQVRDPLVINEIRRLQELADVNAVACVPGIPQKIGEGAHKGAETLIQILEDERDHPDILKLKANIALELLARAGYGGVKQVKVQQAHMSAHLTEEEIEELKRRAFGEEA